MNALVVYAHPNPESFNHALLESVQAGLEKAGHKSQGQRPLRLRLQADFRRRLT